MTSPRFDGGWMALAPRAAGPATRGRTAPRAQLSRPRSRRKSRTGGSSGARPTGPPHVHGGAGGVGGRVDVLRPLPFAPVRWPFRDGLALVGDRR